MSNTIVCPEKFTCTRLFGQTEHVCCSKEDDAKVDSEVSAAEPEETVERQQSSEFIETSNFQLILIQISF